MDNDKEKNLNSTYLVSDEVYTDGNRYRSNHGITLPSNVNALYNIGLSPLFITRTGRPGTSLETYIMWRGRSNFAWSTTVSPFWSNGPYYISNYNGDIYPSDMNMRTFAHSLRCLVSTNNG